MTSPCATKLSPPTILTFTENYTSRSTVILKGLKLSFLGNALPTSRQVTVKNGGLRLRPWLDSTTKLMFFSNVVIDGEPISQQAIAEIVGQLLVDFTSEVPTFNNDLLLYPLLTLWGTAPLSILFPNFRFLMC